AILKVLSRRQPLQASDHDRRAVHEKRSVDVGFTVARVAQLVAIAVGVTEDQPELRHPNPFSPTEREGRSRSKRQPSTLVYPDSSALSRSGPREARCRDVCRAGTDSSDPPGRARPARIPTTTVTVG